MRRLGTSVLLAALALAVQARAASPVDPQKLGDLVGDQSFLPLTPDNVRDKLAPIVVVKPQEPYEGSWVFQSEKGHPEVILGQVQFTERKKGQWALSQFDLMVKPQAGDTRGFYDAVVTRVRAKLGKHAAAKNSPPDGRSTTWKLQKGMRLWVEEHVDRDAGKLVEVRLAVPQGERD